MLAAAAEKKTLIAPEAGEWPGLPEARVIPGDLLSLSVKDAEKRFFEKVELTIRRDNRK
ncbi:hypothetical protein ACM25O_13195 [Sulfitobacter pontiacus]